MLVSLFDSLLYNSKTYREFTQNLLASLRRSSLKNRAYASKIEEYLHLEKNKGFLSEAEKLKQQAATELVKIAPASFTVSGRKKALRSYVQKIDKSYPDLDDVKDEYAFRIIISDAKIGKAAAVTFCYIAAFSFLDFFLERGFYPKPIRAKSDGSVSEAILEQIYIPTQIPNLSEDYVVFLKDYILHPKSKGYQGLHILLRDSKTGRWFEFQIRTLSQHNWAEYGEASHDLFYKPGDDSNLLHYDRLQNMEGLIIDGEKILQDQYGILIPQPIGEIYSHQIDGDPITWVDKAH